MAYWTDVDARLYNFLNDLRFCLYSLHILVLCIYDFAYNLILRPFKDLIFIIKVVWLKYVSLLLLLLSVLFFNNNSLIISIKLRIFLGFIFVIIMERPWRKGALIYYP